MPAVSFQELLDGFEFADFRGVLGEHQAFLCKSTGKIYLRIGSSDLDDDLNEEELPEDIEDDEKYVMLPGKHDLDLGTRLVLAFAHAYLSDHLGEVEDMFSRRGGYKRFRALLTRTGTLDRWYDFENEAKEQALRAWCASHGIDVVA